MTRKKITEKPEEELQKLLEEKREKLRQLRFSLAGGKIKNISEIRKTRKEIARILTLLNSKYQKSNNK